MVMVTVTFVVPAVLGLACVVLFGFGAIGVQGAVTAHPTNANWRCTARYCLSDLSTKWGANDADECPDASTDSQTGKSVTFGLATITSAADQSEVEELLDHNEGGWSPTATVWIGPKTFGYTPADARWYPYTLNEAGNANAYAVRNGGFTHWVDPLNAEEWRSGCFYIVGSNGRWYNVDACYALKDLLCNRIDRASSLTHGVPKPNPNPSPNALFGLSLYESVRNSSALSSAKYVLLGLSLLLGVLLIACICNECGCGCNHNGGQQKVKVQYEEHGRTAAVHSAIDLINTQV